VRLLRTLEHPTTFETPDVAEIRRRRKLIVEEVASWPDADPKSEDEFFEWAANYFAAVAERRRAARRKPEPKKE
jgi:predicted HAD superfamily Cof-like phosphohydrolase